jgi:hypothetical protein
MLSGGNSTAFLLSASLIGAGYSWMPAHAGSTGRALGIIGGIAVGAIILNEATKHRRVARSPSSSSKQAAKSKDNAAAVAESNDAQIKNGPVTEAVNSSSNDPFVGVASSRPTRTEE